MSSLSFLCVCLLSLEEPQRKLLILSAQESFLPSKGRSSVEPGWFDAASRPISIATTNRKSYYTKGQEENAMVPASLRAALAS